MEVSGARRGIRGIRDMGAPRGCRVLRDCYRVSRGCQGCQGCIGSWQGL